MKLTYHKTRFIIGIILWLVASILLSATAYKFGRLWFTKSSPCTKFTFIGCAAIWMAFSVVWRIGKWYTIRKRALIDSIKQNNVKPDNLKKATPEGIEYCLIAGAIALVLSNLGNLPLPDRNEWVAEFSGVIILLFGFAIALWGRIVLGDKWFRDVHIPSSLVQSGPYKYVRHPIYTGEIIMAVGTSIWSHNLFVLLVLFGGMLGFNYFRSLAEEEALLQYFGSSYKQFINKRSRFFPRLHFR